MRERELPEVDPPQLSRAQDLREVGPRQRASGGLLPIEVHEPAALPDQLDLARRRAREVVRLPIERVPGDPPHDPDRARRDEHHRPPEPRLDPDEHRREKRDADELARRVEPDRRRTLPLGEPRRHHAVVDRVRRRLERADDHSNDHERRHARR